MTFAKKQGLLATAIWALVLASCGAGNGGQPAANGDGAFQQWVAQQTWQPSAGIDGTGLPSFPAETGRRSPSAAGDSITVLGSECLQQHFAVVDGDALVIGPAQGEHHPAYGLYRFAGLGGMSPHALNVRGVPGELGMRYFVGLANFTRMRWDWFGPVSVPEFQHEFNGESGRYISALGNMYMVVVAHGNNVVRHESSTLTFGSAPPDDPTPPGAPTGLIASDGAFPDGVGLTWQPGEGAEWYRVFRNSGNGGDPGTPEWTFIGEAQTHEFFDHTAVPGQVYSYKVNAARHGADGQILYSEFSNIDSGYAGHQDGGDEPGAPGGLVATDGTYADHVRLEWGAGHGAQWYRVYRTLADGTAPGWAFIGEAQTNAYNDDNVVSGVIYQYKVQSAAVDQSGTIHYSEFSNTDTGFAQGGTGTEGSIAGVVTGEFPGGATATLLGQGESPLTVQLDPAGTFAFTGLSAGHYVVFVYCPNCSFLPVYWGGTLDDNHTTVTVSFTGGPLTDLLRTWGFIYTYEPGADGAMHWAPLAGIDVEDRLDGDPSNTRLGVTNEWGFYAIDGNPQGMNIQTPLTSNYIYSPASAASEVNNQQPPMPQVFRATTPNQP